MTEGELSLWYADLPGSMPSVKMTAQLQGVVIVLSTAGVVQPLLEIGSKCESLPWSGPGLRFDEPVTFIDTQQDILLALTAGGEAYVSKYKGNQRFSKLAHVPFGSPIKFATLGILHGSVVAVLVFQGGRVCTKKIDCNMFSRIIISDVSADVDTSWLETLVCGLATEKADVGLSFGQDGTAFFLDNDGDICCCDSLGSLGTFRTIHPSIDQMGVGDDFIFGFAEDGYLLTLSPLKGLPYRETYSVAGKVVSLGSASNYVHCVVDVHTDFLIGAEETPDATRTTDLIGAEKTTPEATRTTD
jgi:hypothetical protein